MTYTIETPSGETETYKLSYQELKSEYLRFVAMDDASFRLNIIEAAHLACIICYLKESGREATISDCGIIHELLHVISGSNTRTLADIREQFKVLLELA